MILQGDKDYYEKLWMMPNYYGKFKRNIFYYEKNGRRISQFHMSTGENLLISILNSLYMRNKDRASLSKPCMMFLDEIELALHPSSLKKLMNFLKDISDAYNYAIYFSTHSIELISGINPSNIFFIERHADNTIEIINPCYPAYATRILYDHKGYDNVILVEDDLAKAIIDRILKRERLLNNKLVHVLPCGGCNNVIDLANDVITNNLLWKRAAIFFFAIYCCVSICTITIKIIWQQSRGNSMDLKANAVNVRCPYYRTQGRKWVKCDGIIEESAITQDFANEIQKEFYQENYCWNKYQNCPLVKQIEKGG